MTETSSATMAASLDLGRGVITEKLQFIGQVTGGGAHGPGHVLRQIGYSSSVAVYFTTDNRSGSKRSGNCIWQLDADELYTLDNVATGSRASSKFYVKTDDGVAVELTQSEFEEERQRRWPLQHQQATEALEKRKRDEASRMKREAEQAEARRIELEALAEINAERAAQIDAHGQPIEGELPQLSGTSKQIAYALNIRRAFADIHPGHRALKSATTAKYRIENHRGALHGR